LSERSSAPEWGDLIELRLHGRHPLELYVKRLAMLLDALLQPLDEFFEVREPVGIALRRRRHTPVTSLEPTGAAVLGVHVFISTRAWTLRLYDT